MHEKNKKFKQDGFTLVELMVAIAIMVLLTSLFLVNFNGLSESQNLQFADNALVSDLHKIQILSLSGKNAASGHPASSYEDVFDLSNSASSAQYSLAADDDSPSPQTYSLSSVNLPAHVYLKSVSILKTNSINVSAITDTVYFSVPYGRVLQTYTGSASALKEPDDITTIVLSTTDNTLSKSIVINGITGNITSN